MKKVLILFSGESKESLKTSKSRIGYASLYSFLKNNNIETCRSSLSFYDKENKIFKEAQFFENGEWIWKKDIMPDLVYDKTRFGLSEDEIKIRKIIEKDFNFYNSLKLSELMSNKALTYEFLKEFSPNSVVIYNLNDFKKIENLKTDKIIIKPLGNCGGEGIFISKKNSVEKDLKKEILPVIIQEFIDSSKVKNEFLEGNHDIRIIVINKNPFYCFARFPQKDKFLANIAQGGSLKVLNVEKLLKNDKIKEFVFSVINRIDEIDNNRKLYAIDFMIDNNEKVWLIELNSRPGLVLEKEEKEYKEIFYNGLIALFNF